MSAKKNNKKSGKRTVLWIVIAVEILLLAAALVVWWAFSYSEKAENAPAVQPGIEATVPEETAPEATTPPPVVEEMVDTTAYLDDHLQIINVGAYTGMYVEDGTDEVVSGVLMLVVKNFSKEAVQYAEITLPTENGDAKFTLSTLPAGESCVLLEQSRMQHTGSEDITRAVSDNVAVFSEELSLQEETLKFQVLDGAINITNISGEDIAGDIVVYYKNAAADLYYGGITYRVRIEGGLKADEIRQIMASHFSESGSKLMFVTIG